MPLTPWQTEGKARFQVGSAFYNPASRTSRDLGVLAAAVQRAASDGLRLLDATSGCGVRALRYAWESEATWLWVNEANPELHELLTSNLAPLLTEQRAQLTHQNARRLFATCAADLDYYDFIDLDCFGSVAPFLAAALGTLKIGGLLYATSTDGRSATGHQPTVSLQAYGAYARVHPAAREQALRLLLGALQQQAAALGFGIQPGFSFWAGATHRVLVRLQPKPNLTPDNYGFLGYCQICGEYQTILWQKLGRTSCDCGQALTHSGPLWLGALHDRPLLTAMGDRARSWQWFSQAKLLDRMHAEAELPPYYFPLGEIGRRGKLDVPSRSQLLAALQASGFQATPTHCDAEAVKTDATLADCVAIARQIVS
ncbi:MAG: tRNA (guanine-N1)-methyltransferase [Spirulinaceae cyanobacterium SM2_1_0]|nr:tRNA (guanine-N1)-methyltransferase [Spirulinaceae cyanobacterium SM2_1_0]